jgi:PHD/YefM family antitoxin component YafN of YafNO toxin-antitoxin module
MTKSDIFKVPIEAVILSKEEFSAQNNEALNKTGKSITNSRVRNRLRGSIAESRKGSVMATFKAQQEAETKLSQP